MSLSKENKVMIDGKTYYGGLNQPNLKFIKVNVDCWETIFDLLSPRDILAMSQTCQRMRQIGGYYFRENLNSAAELCPTLGLRLYTNNTWYKLERNDFLRFVKKLWIEDELEHLRAVANVGLLTSLTTLRLYGINLNEQQLRGLENIQNNIESIELFLCFIGDNFFTEFLASCPKLKCLRFSSVTYESLEVKRSLLHRTYPMLEQVKLLCEDTAPELPTFLERNPSMKCLEITAFQLLEIPLDTSKVQLDYLNVCIEGNENGDNGLFGHHPNELLNRLQTLHANGFFKKLRLDCAYGNDCETFMRQMASFSGLEVLYAKEFHTDTISGLTELKELKVDDVFAFFYQVELDWETMAKHLINLERLWIVFTVDKLLPFLRYSKRLKLVIFETRNRGCNALNLSSLNETRKMGGMQRKLRIGLGEKQYLATKWAENNVNYDLVEITRMETIIEYFDLE